MHFLRESNRAEYSIAMGIEWLFLRFSGFILTRPVAWGILCFELEFQRQRLRDFTTQTDIQR